MNTRFAKRFIDVCGALVGLALCGPILVAASIVVFATMGSPILFRQWRTGLRECEFTIFKLRTMVGPDPGTSISDGDRLTAAGRVLRKYSIDELPQLFNVIRGEMSLVGPRPLPPQYLPRYTASQRRRHEVKPGITGWAQINGRNGLSWHSKFEHDLWYIENWSLMLDVRILWMTFGRVIRKEGVNQVGQDTMTEFTGIADPEN
jgi:lipopolysaccharide/colanic/teichoic acid biosynthesis glycosyltransferase